MCATAFQPVLFAGWKPVLQVLLESLRIANEKEDIAKRRPQGFVIRYSLFAILFVPRHVTAGLASLVLPYGLGISEVFALKKSVNERRRSRVGED